MSEFIDFSNRQNRFIREKDVGDAYVKKMMEKVQEDNYFYPSFHIVPKHGLLNDPNGLYQDDEGYYHIFYQWFPYGTVHGLKHWYELKTKDFKQYVDLGVGISPDDEFDSHGCYTGMTFYDEGNYHVYYTGIVKEGDDLVPTTVHARIKNEKIEKTGVIETVDLSLYTYNFRDPFVFKRNNLYYMITGAEDIHHQGVLLLSKSLSPDKGFERLGEIELKDKHHLGYMLECPNYFEENDTGVLVFSPQGIESDSKYNYRNVFSVVYAVGKPIDVDNLTFDYTNYYELDKGFDFYAPQVFTDNQNRRILYGWLGNSKTAYPSDNYQWAHMLTIPREIKVIGDKLSQTPLKELANLRGNIEENLTYKEVTEKAFELNFVVKEGSFKLYNEKQEFIEFKVTDDEYIFNRGHMTYTYNNQYGQVRYAKREKKSEHQARVFIDHSSIEVFLDDGLTVFTARFYLEGDWMIQSKGFSFDFIELESIVVE